MQRLDPAYRAKFHDGSEILVRHGHEAMRDEIARICGGARTPPRSTASSSWLRQLYDVEMPHFIDRNFDSPLGLLSSPAAAAKLVRLGGFGRLGPAVRRRFDDDRLERLFTFQAMYAGLPPCHARWRCTRVITYMDCIEGVWFPDGGMSAVPRALARRPPRTPASSFRWSTSVTRVAAPLRRRRGRRRGRRRREDRRRRRRVHPRPAGRLPARCCPTSRPPARSAQGRLLPLRRRVARRRARRAARGRAPPQHPLRRGVGRLLRRADQEGPDDARPLAPGHRADADRPLPGARGRAHALRAGAGAQPRRRRRLAPAARRRCASRCSASSSARATPPTSSPRSSSTPSTGSARAWSAARRSRWPTRSCRPGRSGRRTSRSGCPACSSPAPAPRPASACRWCWSRVGWRPSASRRTCPTPDAGAPGGDPRRSRRMTRPRPAPRTVRRRRPAPRATAAAPS